jgi:DNA-directed RNA polymerase specialized sigma subunit
MLPADNKGLCRPRLQGHMEGHLSVATIEALNKIVRTCRHLRHAIGREPTTEEVASRLRMPPETIRKALGPPCTLTTH